LRGTGWFGKLDARQHRATPRSPIPVTALTVLAIVAVS
jgi:hypothetical protein